MGNENWYAAVDGSDRILHVSDGPLGNDHEAQAWHQKIGSPGKLVVVDLAAGECPYVGDRVDVDSDGVATLIDDSTPDYDKFVAVVFEGVEFDENAESDDLLRSANRFDALRKHWLGKSPYTPSGSLNDLVSLFYAHAKRVSSDFVLEVERAFDLLSQYCLEKHRASHRRKIGRIELAQQYEENAERIYKQIPQAWRW